MSKFKEITVNSSTFERIKELSHMLNIPICDLVCLCVDLYCEENNGTK
jgi:hypothetical protein